MPKKRGSQFKDPIRDLGIIMTLLSFLFMIAYANPFNPLPFMVSIVGFGAGLYIVTLRVYPKEAKYWREFVIDKLNLLFNWSKETIQKYRERRGKKRGEPK